MFVCTNSRKNGERVSCGGEGRCGEALLIKLKNYVKEQNLQKTFRVVKSGCHDRCELGPNIMVFPQNELLSDVSPEDLNSIIQAYLDA